MLMDWFFVDCRCQGASVDHTLFKIDTIANFRDEAIHDTAEKERNEPELQLSHILHKSIARCIE